MANVWQIGQLPDRLQPDIFFDQLRCFLFQKLFEQFHQRENFTFGALPVFGRKSVERKILHFQLGTAFHTLARSLCALFVAFDSRQTARPGPSAVTVHNNGDVPWDGLYHRGHCFRYKKIVWARVGPTLTIDNLAPVSWAMRLT